MAKVNINLIGDKIVLLTEREQFILWNKILPKIESKN